MVYFTCDACGEQLKKPSVEKHYTQKCRDCYKLTCIDCLKDFFGDDYKSHNACMSEDQRYSKEGRAGWDPSQGSGHKGEKKQNAWVNNLRAILAETTNLDSDVRNIVNTILDHENIPRKRAKFTNFVKNIMRNKASAHSIDKTWDLFSQALAPPQQAEENGGDAKEMNVDVDPVKEEPCAKKEKKKKKKDSDSENNVQDVKKSKKRKLEDIENCSEKENSEEKFSKKKKKKKHGKDEQEEKVSGGESMEVDENREVVVKKKFNWEETIEELLKKNDGSMKLKKLKKKCINELLSLETSKPMSAEEASAKFDKKIKKLHKFKVLHERISLKEDSSQQVETSAEVESKPSDVGEKVVEESEASFNNWESANLGSSAQNEKFRRLMGIKSSSKEGAGKFGGDGRNDKKIFSDLERGFEKARQMHFGARCFNS